MKRSSDRIITTHVGSLVRPDDLVRMVQARANGEPHDAAALMARIKETVTAVVKRQAETGIDVINDGEFGKPSFLHYVNERLDGFAPGKARPAGNPFAGSREFKSFPEFYEKAAASGTGPYNRAQHLECVGPITYMGHQQLKNDIDTFTTAMSGAKALEGFMPAIAPSNVEAWQTNKFYKSAEEYLYANAEAMRVEYQAIVAAGLILQIDDPRLVTHLNRQPSMSIDDVRNWARIRVEALNHALRGMPREMIRFHTCYGINMGPRIHESIVWAKLASLTEGARRATKQLWG